MRFQISLTLLLIIPYFSFAQSQLKFNTDFQIEWKSIEIENDSMAQNLASTNPTLEFRYDNFPELFHVINLNDDLYPDAIFYWPDNSNEPIFEVYINNKGTLELKLEKRGTISGLELNKLSGSMKFILNEIGYSSPPFLNRIHIVDILTSKNNISQNTIIYFGETSIPIDFNIYQRFEVTQSKYRLRQTPDIRDNNIICELTDGDTGTAIASKTDDTGREWWFIIADNNIKKDVNEYFYIDFSSPDGLNNQMLGWMSSRYVKTIE